MRLDLKGETRDQTKKIQDSLEWDGARCVEIPYGTWIIDGAIKVRIDQTLALSPGTQLKRRAKSNDSPMVLLCGNKATLDMRGGEIVFEKTAGNAPNGVVAHGPEKPGEMHTICWPRIQGPGSIWAPGLKGSRGVSTTSNQSDAIPDAATYMAKVVDVWIGNCDIGWHIGQQCNAAQGRDIDFNAITKRCYEVMHATNCRFSGGFTHASHEADCIAYAEGGYGHWWDGVMGEPGVRKGDAKPPMAYDFSRSKQCSWVASDECNSGSLPGPQTFSVDKSEMRVEVIRAGRIEYQESVRVG